MIHHKIALAGLATALLAAQAAAAPATERTTVEGLRKPAEILIDHWGIPHIYAASARDAIFLQGFNAARDRLWQIDLWRKRGLGLLAADFGPDYVDQDHAARLFLYRGDMAAEWAAYGPKAKSYAEAFTAGVNAYVADVRAGKRPLPREFAIAGTQPDLWRAEDVVRIRSHGLTRNVAEEVKRARIACLAGLDATRLQHLLEPAWTTQVPAGLDPCDVPAGVLKAYELATQAVSFTPKPGGGAALAALDVPPEAIGSNNWTVSGARTATGRPILANDPHRAHGFPSLRYIVHLEAPGFSVIGAGEPALPGVSIGHNDKIAFGLTIFAADQEDLYVYETDPKAPDRYRYGDGWETMRTVREAIAVKGEAPRQVELRFTRHGPVVFADPGKRRAFAIRSVWGDPGTSAYFGSADYMTAKDWPQFKAAMARFGAPSENQVYADTDGHIGWVAAGRAPVRPGWDGLLPVPGDGRYEWNGFLAADQLPSVYDPPQGWFASANQMNLPAGYPFAERKVGFEWSNPARFDRIAQVLAAKPKLTVADAEALQTDPYNTTADKLLPLLAGLTGGGDDLRQALALLSGWDRRAAADSAGGALYEVWIGKHLGPATVAATAPPGVRALLGGGDLAAVIDLLQHPATAGLSDAARDEVLRASLKAAFAEVRGHLSPDPAKWRWGDLHKAEFIHALTPLASGAEHAAMATGILPVGGTALSPWATTWRPNDYRVVAGASFRMVLDVGAWDNSMTINSPGQSGEPGTAHATDLFAAWAKGDYVPLLYSRPAVEAATETRIALTPK